MKSIQYTIRGIPEPVDRYFRKLAELRGKSLNQVIVDEMSDKAGINKGRSLYKSLDWFIGSGSIEQEVVDAIDDHRREQRALAAREREKLEALGL